ncbi:sulfatase-like hydrolase/transferase [Flavivirga amylovorans]|uniref:Sulfatase-like hydrolase/transferase n=1 Tax=Flavivirga amylovorans TaxID=870486 RepID=A0ABT8WWW9_9FLAO|nr:sulfatase-like hydrolase/transferase [Flavivirga amylovorans]MDO5986181.1 sulfatase-like hydrolase/transferase [Flavivirga amylovorans]
MNINKLLLCLVTGLLIFSASELRAQDKKKPSKKPNIIFIYADDLGRGMLSTYGQKHLTTPNIDKLGDQGLKFENAYGVMYCAPARASLLTGMHDARRDEFNLTNGGIWMELDQRLTMGEITDKIHNVIQPAKEGDVFLGQIAQQAGYTTAEFGKLEWGFATTPQRIERHGWDYHFGYYDHKRCHGFYPPFLFENGKKIDIPGNTHVDCAKTPEEESPENYKERWNMEGKKVYSENIIMDKMLVFMDEHNPKKTNKPFFIYFPTQLPHGPISIPEVHPELKDNPNLNEFEKEYGSMVKMLDRDVGRIYNKLEEMGILDNTIIVFSSDNGHNVYTNYEGRTDQYKNVITGEKYDDVKTKFYSDLSNDVFDGNNGMAGYKRHNWEGGVRVPLFWYWKGKINPGVVSQQRVSNYDFLNTLAEITGVPQIEEKDGVSYAKTLFGEKAKERPYTIVGSKLHGGAIITNDGWKLRHYIHDDIFQLYHLPDDYKEAHDLVTKYPEKVEELKAVLFKELGNNWKNGLGPVKENYKLYKAPKLNDIIDKQI